ncbi:DUF1307 domain-containing protein [Vagococcus elongatus]|uniref:DUF1307 domain-containing protein n=1 Tax=Vagococcus elongatus TaxID=180344 RepID=UPI0014771967|nr:DUF1307 domain-containing protein [Vagococcus elongatus]
MKKILSFCILTILCVFTTACSSEKIATYEQSVDGSEVQVILTIENDDVRHQKQITRTSFDKLAELTETEKLSAADLTSLKNDMLKKNDVLDALEGVSYQISFKDEHLVETVELDYQKVNLNALAAIKDLDFKQPHSENDYISAKAADKQLRKLGFKLVN